MGPHDRDGSGVRLLRSSSTRCRSRIWGDPVGDHRSFNDRRTFFGVYVNDEWTPVSFLTITAGARFDSVSESLFAKGQEVGAPERRTSLPTPVPTGSGRAASRRSRGSSAIAPGAVNEINLYVAAKSAFKPAAPNLTEAESATILEPERTRSGEIGVKTRWLDRQLSFDVSLFHMIFENLVVSTVGPDGNPELTNAGKERFQGMELEAGYHPKACRTSRFSPATPTTTRGTSGSRSSIRTPALRTPPARSWS